jgi:hypothetical protein
MYRQTTSFATIGGTATIICPLDKRLLSKILGFSRGFVPDMYLQIGQRCDTAMLQPREDNDNNSANYIHHYEIFPIRIETRGEGGSKEVEDGESSLCTK